MYAPIYIDWTMKIQIILGSTRNGRIGERVANWIYSEVEKIAKESEEGDHPFEIEFLDLLEWDLPMYQEPFSESAEKWAVKIAEGDGFIMVTPEYNHSFPAVLKNAIDYVGEGWYRKPVGLVGYSEGMSAGIRAVEQLKPVLVHLQMAPISKALYFPEADNAFNDQGQPKDAKTLVKLEKFLDELLWWVRALKVAREA